MIDNNEDTIAAIATPAGNSGIGIIRISGKDAIKIADKMIRSRSNKSLDLFSSPSHKVHYGYAYDGNRVLDEVLCTVFLKPRSYTAEDTVEISCHGGMLILKEVLSSVTANGARLAEPGEFTKRAYLNGRIDLSQAESVMDIINSENEFSRKNSISQLRGSLKEKIEGYREILIHECAFIESALDDPEHYQIEEEDKKRISSKIDSLVNEITEMLQDTRQAVFLKDGINTVIAGKPNVGKSSFLNLMSGYDKAIVTSVPGTTRDVIEERINIDGVILNMTDTAGIHDSLDPVESIGINKTLTMIEKADLVVFMIDASEDLNEEDEQIADMIKEKSTVILMNKTDLASRADISNISEKLKCPIIWTSIKESKGIDEFKRTIVSMFDMDRIKDTNKTYVTNLRQIDELKKAKESLEFARASIMGGMSEDTYTVDIMDAYEYLGSIIGEDTDDDLTDRVFSEFCMGK